MNYRSDLVMFYYSFLTSPNPYEYQGYGNSTIVTSLKITEDVVVKELIALCGHGPAPERVVRTQIAKSCVTI